MEGIKSVKCKYCNHEFNQSDVVFYWYTSGLCIQVQCPECETYLEAQISLFQKPIPIKDSDVKAHTRRD